MTAKEIRRNLETIDKTLENFVQTVMAAPARAADLQPRLTELAGIMKNMHEQHASLKHDPQVVCLIRNIQARLARLQLLLDSAVTFYCGAISAAISQTGAYTANGELPYRENSGYLHLQA
jgi:hypothetical protein